MFADGKTEALADLIRERTVGSVRSLLVVGCGSGIEAAILAQALKADTIGIDPDAASFDPRAARTVELRTGDATRLDFDDGAFDCVFSYHALEHIPDYQKALTEMDRVLSAGGTYCIGTPNRRRLIGYLGSKDADWYQVLKWNAADWQARLRGEFRNEYGAHAGFSSAELRAALETAFGHAEEITEPYYARVYRNHARALHTLRRLHLTPWLLPSVYFFGYKRGSRAGFPNGAARPTPAASCAR